LLTGIAAAIPSRRAKARERTLKLTKWCTIKVLVIWTDFAFHASGWRRGAIMMIVVVIIAGRKMWSHCQIRHKTVGDHARTKTWPTNATASIHAWWSHVIWAHVCIAKRLFHVIHVIWSWTNTKTSGSSSSSATSSNSSAAFEFILICLKEQYKHLKYIQANQNILES